MLSVLQCYKGLRLIVDCVEYIEHLESIAQKANTHFLVCIDVDLSMRIMGLYFGVCIGQKFVRLEDMPSLAKRIIASTD